MKTKSLRVSEDIIAAVKLIEKQEKIEESTAMRKLMKIGFEFYLSTLYKHGKISLRDAAKKLHLSLNETIDLFLSMGVKGNISATEIFQSLDYI